jgi:4-hydroxy-tetrahydrodipicolinate reductase
MMSSIRVLVIGAAGRMGSELVRAIAAQDDMLLAGAVDRLRVGEDAGEVAGLAPLSAPITDWLSHAIPEAKPDVAVDFTLPQSVMANARTVVSAKVPCVVGATGLKPANLEELGALCREHDTPALVAPNFAIGAVLMMQFAAEAARHFEAAEIVELHHATKIDAPSGTALRTAELIAAAAGRPPAAKEEDMPRARGRTAGSVQIHSVRLPGLVAHQEVIFGGLGQTLSIRHDSISRESFMPGVLLAIRKVRGLSGLTVGLEKIL